MYYHVDYRRYKAVLKCFFYFLLLSFFLSHNSYAAIETDEERAARQLAARQEFAKTVYNKDLSAYTTVSSSSGTVSATNKISATISNGAKVSAVSSIEKPSNLAKVASTLAKRLEKAKALGKASLPSFIGSAALTALVNGIGWLIDEGGKVTKVDTTGVQCKSDGSDCKYAQNLYYVVDIYFPSLDSALSYYVNKNLKPNSFSYSITSESSSNVSAQISYYSGTSAQSSACYSKACTITYRFNKLANPNYSSNATQPPTEVNTDEIATKVAEKLQSNLAANVNDATSNEAIANAYTADTSNEMTLSDDTVNGLAKAIGDQVAKSIQDAANSSTGQSSTATDDNGTAKTSINDGTSTATGTSTGTSTTTNPDGTTSTTESTSSTALEFPAFCDWASVVCDFIDWMKEDSSTSDEEPEEIQDIELPTLNTNTFKATSGCPSPIQVNVTIGSKGTTEISYEPICQFAEKWSFVAPLIGFLSGAMILIGVGRKGEDSEI